MASVGQPATVHVTTTAMLSTQPGAARPEAVGAALAGQAPTTHKTATYTVKDGDYLAKISGRFCGSESHYLSLAAANGISDPNLIFPGELVKLACHAAYKAVAAAIPQQPARPQTQTVSSAPAPQPSQASQPAVTGFSGTLSFSGLEALWVAAGGPSWAEYDAAEVGECESGGQQYAENPSGASGYWQILGQVVPGDIFDPMVNGENAVSKFEASGDTFAQWVCQP